MVDRHRQLRVGLKAFVVSSNAVKRIGEPNPAIGMYGNIVRRIQTFPLELIRDNSNCSIRLVASHAPASMLARKLAALVIERVTVAEPGGIAKYRDPSII